MTNDDIWKCKYVTAGEDKDGITVPCCTLCGMPCEDVLRYGDDGCVLSMTTEKAIKIIEDACYWYHKKGCSGLTQVEIFEARDRAIQALNSLEEVYANGYNDGFTQAEVNYENDKALSQEPRKDAEQIDYHDDFETASRKIHDYEERQKQNDKR